MFDDINQLLGQTLVNINATDEEILFTNDEGRRWKLYHSQDCCESVYVEDIVGDLQDLIGNPLLVADERVQDDRNYGELGMLGMWTFYELATIKGSVTIRFYGTSNGYYSVGVTFEEMDPVEKIIIQ